MLESAALLLQSNAMTSARTPHIDKAGIRWFAVGMWGCAQGAGKSTINVVPAVIVAFCVSLKLKEADT